MIGSRITDDAGARERCSQQHARGRALERNKGQSLGEAAGLVSSNQSGLLATLTHTPFLAMHLSYDLQASESLQSLLEAATHFPS